MITLVTCGCASNHASATRATLMPRLSAIGFIARMHAAARVRSTGGKSKSDRRAPGTFDSFSRSNLPLSRPPASGLHGKMPSP